MSAVDEITIVYLGSEVVLRIHHKRHSLSLVPVPVVDCFLIG